MPITDKVALLKIEMEEYKKLLDNMIQEGKKYHNHLNQMQHSMNEKSTQELSKLTEEYYVDEEQGPRYSIIPEERPKDWNEVKTSFILEHSSEESNRELIKLRNEYRRSHANHANKAEYLYRIGIGLTEEINDLLEELCPGRGYKFELLRGKYSLLQHQLISTKEDFLGGRSVYLQFDSNSEQLHYLMLSPFKPPVDCCEARPSDPRYDDPKDLIKALNLPGYVDEPTKNSLENVEGAQNLLETSMSNSE